MTHTVTQKPIQTAMIIDDEVFDQEMYKRTIERSGLVQELLSFYAADHAMDHLSNHHDLIVDVIFLDINMPRMNGFEFLDQAIARFGPKFAKVCIVMLTTSLNPKDKERAGEFEIVKDFLNKPLSLEHIQHAAELVRQANLNG